jgi:hypothetical protein
MHSALGPRICDYEKTTPLNPDLVLSLGISAQLGCLRPKKEERLREESRSL